MGPGEFSGFFSSVVEWERGGVEEAWKRWNQIWSASS